MKPVSLAIILLLLLTGCVGKNSPEAADAGQLHISADSLSHLEQQMLREWTKFNTTSDSIAAVAEAQIEEARQDLNNPGVHHRGELQRTIIKTQYRLEKLKKQIEAAEDIEMRTETFNLKVIKSMDSIKALFEQEQAALERDLKELQEKKLKTE